MAICPYCGHDNHSGGAYCESCGKQIKAKAASSENKLKGKIGGKTFDAELSTHHDEARYNKQGSLKGKIGARKYELDAKEKVEPKATSSKLKGKIGETEYHYSTGISGAADEQKKSEIKGKLKGKVGTSSYVYEKKHEEKTSSDRAARTDGLAVEKKDHSRLKGKIGNTEFSGYTDAKGEDSYSKVSSPSGPSRKPPFPSKIAIAIGIIAVVLLISVAALKNSSGKGGVISLKKDSTSEAENYYVPVAEETVHTENGVQYVSGQFVVISSVGVSFESMRELFASHELEIIGYIELMDTYQVRTQRQLTLSEMDLMVAELSADTRVDVATIDVVWEAKANGYPDDPWSENRSASAQWDTINGANWGVKAINAPYCWENYDLGRVKVGIIDTMFYPSHEDLSSQVSECNYNAIFDSYVPRDAFDAVKEHGTHVAGIVGATHNNGIGLAGVLENSSIYAYAMWGFDGNMDELSAIARLSNSGAKVINYSMGYISEIVNDAANGDSQTRNYYYEQMAAIDEIAFLRMLQKGYDFVFVVAAGNDTVDALWGSRFSYISTPEVKNRIMIVGAADNRNGEYSLASFSNYGARLDITAPGVQIFSTLPYNRYASWNGTSMAAPHVTGVCASIWAADPELSGSQVKEIVTSSADTPVSGNCPNMVDMKAAMDVIFPPMEKYTHRPPQATEAERQAALLAYAELLHDGVSLDGTVLGKTTKATHYYLFEMDGDGIEEMITYASPHPGEWSFKVFSYKNGRVVQIADSINTCDISEWSNSKITIDISNGVLHANAGKATAAYTAGSDNYLFFDGNIVQNYRTADSVPSTSVSNSFTLVNGDANYGIQIGSEQDYLSELYLQYHPMPTPSSRTSPLSDGNYYGLLSSWSSDNMTIELLNYEGRHEMSFNYLFSPTGQTLTLDISHAVIMLEWPWCDGDEIKCSTIDDALNTEVWGGPSTLREQCTMEISFVIQNSVVTEIVFLYAA